METKEKEIIELLNKAFADEWLAYYQYWIGAKVVAGANKEAVIAELKEHADEELEHADILVDRILQLGGTPILEPKKWYDYSNCGYAVPNDYDVKKILAQNISGEQCAIDVYKKILEVTKDSDKITHKIAQKIMDDEIKHEEDLKKLLGDM
jgi:bacterioferritin